MNLLNLAELENGARLEADLVVIGGGPAGVAIARQFFGTSVRVLLLESGVCGEDAAREALNAVETPDDLWSEAQIQKRIAFHGASAGLWRHERQRFGVRCRGLGGSTAAWAGKSAAFDALDFEPRPWLGQRATHSDWPIARQSLDPYLDRAAAFLNLGPNCYDDALWALMGIKPPAPRPDPAVLRSFFWQFARSRIDPMDIMRVGPEFLRERAENVRVLLNATATQICADAQGHSAQGVRVRCLEGVEAEISARAIVLAAGAIENARLLLASNEACPKGLGNHHDVVGRYVMDHAGARIARFSTADVGRVASRFGFYGVPHDGRVSMYMRGLAPTPAMQEREGMLNCALYMMEERAPDDPWDALKRMLRLKSRAPLADFLSVAGSPGLLAKGLGRKFVQSRRVPESAKKLLVNQLIRFNPNFVAQEFQTGGLPHKLTGLHVDAICEQLPDRENRITLSDTRDALGAPVPHVRWQVGEAPVRTLARLGHMMATEFPRVGLPAPILEPWVAEARLDEAVIIDMAHTMGTTRMSADPKTGVVDSQCAVHGVAGLFVAGGSVFPTSGHANPTLMIVALAERLSDHLKERVVAPA